MIAAPPKGLDQVERQQLADAIRARIEDGDDVIHVMYEPGDATHYELIFARVGSRPPVGATYSVDYPLRTTLGVPMLRLLAGEHFMVSWEGHPAMLIDLAPGNFVHPAYVGEKMNMGPGSAAALAELLCMVNGVNEHNLTQLREQYHPCFAETREP